MLNPGTVTEPKRTGSETGPDGGTYAGFFYEKSETGTKRQSLHNYLEIKCQKLIGTFN